MWPAIAKYKSNDKISSILRHDGGGGERGGGGRGGGGGAGSLLIPLFLSYSQFRLYNLQFLHLAGMNLAYFPGIILPQEEKNGLALGRPTSRE